MGRHGHGTDLDQLLLGEAEGRHPEDSLDILLKLELQGPEPHALGPHHAAVVLALDESRQGIGLVEGDRVEELLGPFEHPYLGHGANGSDPVVVGEHEDGIELKITQLPTGDLDDIAHAVRGLFAGYKDGAGLTGGPVGHEAGLVNDRGLALSRAEHLQRLEVCLAELAFEECHVQAVHARLLWLRLNAKRPSRRKSVGTRTGVGPLSEALSLDMIPHRESNEQPRRG